MRVLVAFIAFALVLSSCGGKRGKVQKTAPASPNQRLGVKNVSDFYAAACSYSTGTDDGGKRYAKLEMSKSPTLDSAANITALNLSNIALMFYKDLEDERKNYDSIKVGITFSNGQHVERGYATPQLAMVLDKYAIVNKVVEALKAQRYSGLDSLLNDQNGTTHFDKKRLIESIRKADPAIGHIKSFVPYGFIMITADNGKEILHFSGMMIRDNKNNEFSVDIDPDATDNRAIFVNYKL